MDALQAVSVTLQGLYGFLYLLAVALGVEGLQEPLWLARILKGTLRHLL
ncbi:hypothetical protein [Pseudomonas mosselii]|nr:hypothetical protein [Pseudomonas mosselii]